MPHSAESQLHTMYLSNLLRYVAQCGVVEKGDVDEYSERKALLLLLLLKLCYLLFQRDLWRKCFKAYSKSCRRLCLD
jgi:hypothetical protein